ncbi:MAG: hypothetical protein QOH88_395 [Verrucomicrobiota bacterium]|jgi:hypothetical protein
MRTPLAFFVVALAVQSFGAQQPASIRTINNLPNFPLEALRVGVSHKLYRSLAVSPITAWVVARTTLVRGHSANAKIIHSEGNGVYDQMLLAMANGYSVSGQNTIESRVSNDSLDVHLLIYELKDGKMAVCFSHSDDARYLGYKQSGIAWVGVLHGGKWVTISGKDERKWGGQ